MSDLFKSGCDDTYFIFYSILDEYCVEKCKNNSLTLYKVEGVLATEY
jgi:hypothetical protein